MENNYQFLRDKVELSQRLVNYLQSKSFDCITVVARIIDVKEDLVFDNRDLVLVAETIIGNNKLLTLNAQNRDGSEFGLNGFVGKKVEILARSGTNFSVSLLGSNGIIGQKGKNGQFSQPALYDNPGKSYFTYLGLDGEKGFIGGNGGNGGQVIINSIDTEVISLNNVLLSGGNQGSGGEGGEGGNDLICKMEKFSKETTGLPPKKQKDDFSYEEVCERGKQANKGQKGDDGINGQDGKLIYRNLSNSEWFEKANSLCVNWSQYRTKIAEYLFRSVNNPVEISNFGSSKEIISTSLNELESAIKLDKNNLDALLLYKRILVFHSPLGQYRFKDILPDFESYKLNYTSYFDFVKDVKDIAFNYLNLTSLKTSISKVLEAQKLTIVATRKGVEIKRDSVIQQIENKTKDLNERIKKSKELESQIQMRKSELEDDANSGFGAIAKDIKVVITIGAAIYTGGASLITAASDIAKISDSATDIFGAISDLESFDEFKTAFGEFVDVSRGDLKLENSSYGKLIKGAKDFVDASNSFNEATNKFNSSSGILLDLEKTISQIKGINTDDARLKQLLNEQAENLREIINLRKEIDTLNYDKEVAIKQIEVFKLTEQKVSTLSITEENSKEELFLNFMEMMKLSQIYMDYLMLQIFYSYRCLEIQQFTNYSDKISYHFGYFYPDLESDCTEFNDEISRSKLFEAYNKSWADIGKSVINAQNEFDSFSKNGNWSNYIMRLSLNDALLKKYIDNPLSEKLSFTIDESNIEFSNKKYIRIQSVKISFVNAILKSGNSQFNAILHQSGNVSQNTEENVFKSALLEGLTTGIPDVETKELGNSDFDGAIGVIGFNVGFKLSYRPIYSSYEISIEPSEISKIDLGSVTKVQVWFRCVYRD